MKYFISVVFLLFSANAFSQTGNNLEPSMNIGNYNGDTKNIIVVVEKAKSPIWKGFSAWRGKTKSNGLSGKKKRYYEWDYTHNDIEVYDSKGKHLGSMDAMTGSMYKPAVNGRTIDI